MDKETLRKQYSALLMHTDENHYLHCNVLLEEAFGLNTLQMNKCIGVFQQQTEGIIWFIIEYCEEPIEYDDMRIQDLINIYNELTHETN